MTDLLTAKDVEVKAFKKVSFGGYAIQEVEDFLNQIADDLEAYAMRLNERENRITELEEYVKKQESMADMIKDALLQARKSAKEMEDQARVRTEGILDDARREADKLLSDANVKMQDVDFKSRTKIEEAEKTAAEIVAEANIRVRELEAQARVRLEDAERAASDIVAHANAAADEIARKAAEMQQKSERQWRDFEDELAVRRKEAAEEAEHTLFTARTEARRVIDESSKEVQEYDERLRYLSLQKQQFLKDTVALLIDFGHIVDKAKQEVGSEMERERGEDAGDSYTSQQSPASRMLIDRFRKNLLEGKPDDKRPLSDSSGDM